MKLQKVVVLALAALMVAAVFGACSSQPAASTSPSQETAASPSQEAAASPSQEVATSPAAQADGWKITVEGAGVAEFTNADYDKLSKVTIDVVQKKKDGSETPQKWEGVLLKDVVAALGITDYTSLTLAASDDYAKDYTPDIVDDSKTIIGAVCNGEALGADGGWVEAVAGSQGSNMWIKNLVKITVNK